MKALLHLLRTALNDRDELECMPNGFVDDASRLNRTRVSEVRSVAGLRDDPEEQLRAHLQHARARKLPLSIAGTRHTMGGQTFTPGGIILDMLGLHKMQLDEQRNILHVQAGARWSNVLSYLHERGCSIKVMQSNNSFSVGGSLSANSHGWQPTIIPTHRADLLNVTIRFVAPDQESFLRYADQDMFALVMLFNQPRTQQADQQVAGMTRELIEAALAVGGRYYLPYRLHATVE